MLTCWREVKDDKSLSNSGCISVNIIINWSARPLNPSSHFNIMTCGKVVTLGTTAKHDAVCLIGKRNDFILNVDSRQDLRKIQQGELKMFKVYIVVLCQQRSYSSQILEDQFRPRICILSSRNISRFSLYPECDFNEILSHFHIYFSIVVIRKCHKN